MPITTVTNLDSLIDDLRLRIGDTDPTAYRYLDEWLRTALVAGVKTLGRWWNYKYLITTDGTYNVYRNPHGSFIFDEPTYGTIEQADEEAIVLMSAFLLLQGSLENSAWDFVSWADAEIRFSNLESNRSRTDTLTRIWKELTSTLKTPTQRLAHTLKLSLPGFLQNEQERDIHEPG
jgi:hypothetical protein